VPNPLHPGNNPALAHIASPVLAHPLLAGLFTPNPAFNPLALHALTAATLVHPGLVAGGAPSLATMRAAHAGFGGAGFGGMGSPYAAHHAMAMHMHSVAAMAAMASPAGVNPAFVAAMGGGLPHWATGAAGPFYHASPYSGSLAGFGANPQQAAVAHVMSGLH
jgi:hypothetical protein